MNRGVAYAPPLGKLALDANRVDDIELTVSVDVADRVLDTAPVRPGRLDEFTGDEPPLLEVECVTENAVPHHRHRVVGHPERVEHVLLLCRREDGADTVDCCAVDGEPSETDVEAHLTGDLTAGLVERGGVDDRRRLHLWPLVELLLTTPDTVEQWVGEVGVGQGTKLQSGVPHVRPVDVDGVERPEEVNPPVREHQVAATVDKQLDCVDVVGVVGGDVVGDNELVVAVERTRGHVPGGDRIERPVDEVLGQVVEEVHRVDLVEALLEPVTPPGLARVGVGVR
jgi:hypothetical protein